jgi:hypothetical protein
MLEGVGARSLNKTASPPKPARQVVTSFMLDGDNNMVPSVMPPPPPRLLKLSAKVADVSAISKQQAIDDSEGMAPPFARTTALAPPPMLLKWSAKVADVSANSQRQALDDSEGMAPPFSRTVAMGRSVDNSKGSFVEQARGRERSASNAGFAGEGSDKTIQRTRSYSVGAAPAGIVACGSCDTILEEEIIESATESIDFDIDLARENP